jgi:nucleoside phosphorylase
MRRGPSTMQIKRLFAASGGRCAFPQCPTNLMPDSGVQLAEVAHISAASPGGPRFDPTQADEERHSVDNLILLCPTHHALIDSAPAQYNVAAVREMKVAHELRIRRLLDAYGREGPTLESRAAMQLARQVDTSVVDIALVAAIPLEIASILRYFPTLEKVTLGPDSRTYYYGIVLADDGKTQYRIVATLLLGMGNVEAATGTASLIHDWNPRYIIMCGIAGGLKPNNQQLGDVVVSTEVIYYELGKLLDTGIERRLVSYRADTLLLDRAMHMHAMPTWRARLPPRPDGKSYSPTFPSVHFGPLASGDKVIASAVEGRKLLALHPKLAGVEMEGGGVATSAFAAARRVGFFMVRSICDFADKAKTDSWQDFAAHAAASFVAQFVATRPIAPSDAKWLPEHRPMPTVDPVWVRKVFYPRICASLNMEELRDFCFILKVDVDDLEGTTKRAKVRELLLRAERRGRMPEIVSAYEEFVTEDKPGDIE